VFLLRMRPCAESHRETNIETLVDACLWHDGCSGSASAAATSIVIPQNGRGFHFTEPVVATMESAGWVIGVVATGNAGTKIATGGAGTMPWDIRFSNASARLVLRFQRFAKGSAETRDKPPLANPSNAITV
jgi:hypothetical protein